MNAQRDEEAAPVVQLAIVDASAAIGAETKAPGPPGAADGAEQPSGKPQTWRERLKGRLTSWPSVQAWFVANFLLISFLVAATIALAWPVPGRFVGSWQTLNVRIIQALNNFMVFLVSGLTLKTEEIKLALKEWRGAVYGLVAILGVTPCLGFVMQEIPLVPSDFALGLTIFCVVPTTLGVGVALVGASKGNQALALLLTVVSNLLGIATVPFLLKGILSVHNWDPPASPPMVPGSGSFAPGPSPPLGAGNSTEQGPPSASPPSPVDSGGVNGNLSIDPVDLLIKLIITVLVPTVIGKVATTYSRHVAAFVKAHRTLLSMFSTANLACIVWMTLSSARNVLVQQEAGIVFAVLGLAIAQHLFYLAANWLATWPMRFDIRERIACVIMASQKSAPVATTIITYVTNDGVRQGLLAIPGLFGQVMQIFIGSILVRFLAPRVKESQD